LDAYDQVTPEDIRRVAEKYLVTRNRTVATLVRPAEGGAK
jgi:predicted Zn-dependent peptidase